MPASFSTHWTWSLGPSDTKHSPDLWENPKVPHKVSTQMFPLQKESLEVKEGKRAEGRFSGEEALVFLSIVEGARAVGAEGRKVVDLVEAEEMGVLLLEGEDQDSWWPRRCDGRSSGSRVF